MPGLPVPYHLPEFVQVHALCIGHVIQPSHSLTPSSPSAHIHMYIYIGFLGGASGKDPAFSAGDRRDIGLIPGLGRSSGGEHGNPLHYSCLKDPMDRGTWQATVHRSQRVGHD